MRESYYLSADKTTQIHAVKWTPSSEPIAIVQIAHGVTEYIERYAPLAKYLTDRGIIVVGNDHLGHGDSIRRDNTPLTIGPKDTEQYLVDDFYTCYKNTKQEHPNLPYILLGFSLGSFVVRVALDKYPDMANGAIIMGTGQQPALMLSLAQAMAKSEAKKAGGFDHWTKKIDDMALGNYNKKFAPTTSKFDWLCANKAAIDAYDADPKKQDHVTIGIFNAMLELMKIASKPRNIKKNSYTLYVWRRRPGRRSQKRRHTCRQSLSKSRTRARGQILSRPPRHFTRDSTTRCIQRHLRLDSKNYRQIIETQTKTSVLIPRFFYSSIKYSNIGA